MSEKLLFNKASLHPFSSVKKVIAIVGGKGGVGKSTLCSLLAVSMQRRGYSVGILDADITGPSIPKAFGLVEQATGSRDGIYPIMSKFGIQIISMNLLLENPTEPVVWRGAVASEYVKQFYSRVIWTDLDILFIDMPPGTGDIPLTVLSSLPIDGAVIVFTPQNLATLIAEKALAMAKKTGTPILGAVENQSYFICPECKEKQYIFGPSVLDRFCNKYEISAKATIPINFDLSLQSDKGLIELFEGDFLEDFCTKLEEDL